MFEIVNVPEGISDLPEQLGTKFKFWYRGEDSCHYLFKEGRPGTGENWAEKVACEICELLTLPHAHYELAKCGDRKGVVSKKFVPDDGRLVHGNELLVSRNTSYPSGKFFKVSEHTLRVVLAIMKSDTVYPPLNWEKVGEVNSALCVFIGYLMLDAWVANQDRHHENWALIRTSDNKTHLAPTYDHASSLGRNESDEERKIKLTTNDHRRHIDYYVTRAKSAFYSQGRTAKQLTTLEAFVSAGKSDKKAAISWLDKIDSIDEKQTFEILNLIPIAEISNEAKEFAHRLLCLNRLRILKTIGDLK